MEKKDIAKKYLSDIDFEVWSRTELKKKHEFKQIGIDLGVTPQRVNARYFQAKNKVNLLYNTLKNEKI